MASIFEKGLKAGLGYPNPGWAPPAGVASDTISGKPITTDMALTADGFVDGIRLIAEDVSSLPLKVYRRLPKGKEEARDHPLFRVLHMRPNPEMTSMVWRETGIGHLLAWGNWYAEKVFNGAGAVVELWPLRPDRMRVYVDRESGRRVYEYRTPDGKVTPLPKRNVFHVPGFGFDGLIGYSRIALMRRRLESSLALEEFGLQTFANGAQPGVVITHPQQLSDTAKKNLKKSWDENHKGLSNVQRTAILDEGMSIDELGFPPEDAQFVEGQHYALEKVARGLRLSPHKLSDLSRATFSNIEESNIDHWVGSLRTTIVRIEQQINIDLIGSDEYFAEHSMDAVMRGKFLERAQGNQILIQSGQRSPNEVRAVDNYGPIPDEESESPGDRFLAPLNMTPLDLLAESVLARTSGAPAPDGGK